MKECGAQEPWEIWDVGSNLSVPLCFGDKDGDEIVFLGQGRVFCRDRKRKVKRGFLFDWRKEDYLISYVETLVSPRYLNLSLCLSSMEAKEVCRIWFL